MGTSLRCFHFTEFDTNGDLAQAGTVATIGGNDNGQFFTELLPSEPDIVLYPEFASGGDAIEVDVTYLGADVESFVVYDVNTGQEVYVTGNEGIAFTGETAEAIVERPATSSPIIPPDVTTLADFGSVTFSLDESGVAYSPTFFTASATSALTVRDYVSRSCLLEAGEATFTTHSQRE